MTDEVGADVRGRVVVGSLVVGVLTMPGNQTLQRPGQVVEQAGLGFVQGYGAGPCAGR